MNVRQSIDLGDRDIDPRVIAEAEAESRSVRLPAIRRHGKLITALICIVVMMVIAGYLQPRRNALAGGKLWLAVPTLIAGIGLLGGAYARIARRSQIRRFRQALCRRGVPVCVECGYSLHGRCRGASECPECGHQP